MEEEEEEEEGWPEVLLVVAGVALAVEAALGGRALS